MSADNKATLPFREFASKAVEIGQVTIEGSEYVLEEFIKKAKEAKMLEEVGDVVQFLEDNLKLTKMRLGIDSEDSWDAKPIPESPFLNLHANKAKEAAGTLVEKKFSKDMQMDIAIQDSSAMLRGYSDAGQEVVEDISSSFDSMWAAWLAKNGYRLVSGVIYKCDKDGEILQDQNGDIRADPVTIRTLADHNVNGFNKYCESRHVPAFNLQQLMIAEAEVPTKKAAAPVIEQPGVSAEPSQAPAPEQPAAQTPSTKT